MPRLIWSPRALLDVQRLHRFLAERNTDAARRAVASGYVARYRLGDDEVLILAVRHQREAGLD